jgi:hypothetical protein
MTKTRPLTEEQWLTERSPARLLRYLQQHRRITKVPGGQRRVWLFKIGCCRLIWDRMEVERSRHAVEICERCVEGQARRTELAAAATWATEADREASQKCQEASVRAGQNDIPTFLSSCAASAARWATYTRVMKGGLSTVAMFTIPVLASNQPDWTPEERSPAARERAAGLVADLARCIFGNPFQPIAIDEAWIADKGSTVARMARAIYDERAFDQLPILSDALEEAGCTDAAILKHCRQDRHHARGCWVVDALLGER